MRAGGPSMLEEWTLPQHGGAVEWTHSDSRASRVEDNSIDLSRHPEGVAEIASRYGVDMGGNAGVYAPSDRERFLVALLVKYHSSRSRVWAEPLEAA